MRDYTAATYGDAIADAYDDLLPHSPGRVDDTDAAVTFLADTANAGRALELGVGTGRIALPLAARGVSVLGIDSSAAMVEQLRNKPGGADLTVRLADFAEVDVEGQFEVVYVAASTLYCLTSQAEQLRCVANVAAHLAPGGVFVVEAFVPDPSRFDRGQRVEARVLGVDRAQLDAARHDPVAQTVSSQQIVITADGIKLYPAHLRYIWPSELDLMAHLVGLEPVGRWGGWQREPFTAESVRHVSVYQRPMT